MFEDVVERFPLHGNAQWTEWRE